MSMADPDAIETEDELGAWVKQWEEVWTSAIQAVGKNDRRAGHSAPWWTDECKTAWRAWQESRTTELEAELEGHSSEKREFLSTVRKAKKQYWQNILDEAESAQDIYKIVRWNNKAKVGRTKPIVHEGATYEDPKDKV